jgi:hypothetical protein
VIVRLAFLLLLGGGLVVWGELRRPRDLRLEIDLADALPGDVAEMDVTVTRDGHALLRLDQRYGKSGAPASVRSVVRARPGRAEVDAMLIDVQGNARRTRVSVDLSTDAAAVVKLR